MMAQAGFSKGGEVQWHSACPRQQSGESKHAAALGVGADLRGRRSAARAADAGPALGSPIDSSFFLAQLRMSPSHFGRQLLGLALQAPEALSAPPSEGSKLHGLFDEDSRHLPKQRLHLQ